MRVSSITKNAGKACNNRLYRHIRTFEKIIKNYFVIYDNIMSKEMIDSERNFECTDITCTPLGDVLLSSGYGLEILKERTISSCEAIVLPVNADSLRFVKYRGNILEMNCDEYCNWSNNITLFLNCETLCVMES